jgi:hypothetical protein
MAGQPEVLEAVNITPEGWKKPPTLLELKQDFTSALVSHSIQTKRVDNWLKNLNIESTPKKEGDKRNSSYEPKLIRKQAEWRYAALSEPFLSAEDLFDIRPMTWEDVEAAKQNKILLNYQFNNKLNKVRFIDEYVRTAVDEGTVIVKVNWEFEEEEFLETAPEVELTPDPAMAELMVRLDQLKLDNPNHYNRDVPPAVLKAHEIWETEQVAYRPSVVGEVKVPKMRTTKNAPCLEICDYRNVIIDPSCRGDLDKANFVIYSFESSLSLLKKDGKYKNLEAILPSQNNPLGDPDHATEDKTDFNFSDKARQKFVVYEYWGYWDIDGSGLVKPIVVAWVGNVIVRMELIPYPDKKLPFVSVQYLPVRKKTHGEPDGHLLEDNQKIAGAVTRGMIDIMGKSANGQTGIRKDALDPVNRRRYDKGLDYEINPNVQPDQAFYMHKYAEIPASAQFMVQFQTFEAEALTGVKSFSSGITGDSLGQVAAGIRGALDAASKRELGIVRRLADGLVQIAKKIVAMNAVFLDDEEIVRVTNEEFVRIRKDELAGDFDMRVTVTTAEEDNAKAQELAFMLQTVGPNTDFGIVKKIMANVADLRKMPDLAKDIRNYEPQPDPIQQEIAQLEVEILRAQVAEIMGKVSKLEADAILTTTKASTEEARVRNLDSVTDLNNLDFVEQESGVKQERDLQRQGEQARANANLQVVKESLRALQQKRKNTA